VKAPAQVLGAELLVLPYQAPLSKMLEEFGLAEDVDKLAKTAGIEKLIDLTYLNDEIIKDLLLTPITCEAKLK